MAAAAAPRGVALGVHGISLSFGFAGGSVF